VTREPGTSTPEPDTTAPEPETEAEAEFLGVTPDGWEHFRISWRDLEPEADL
jgi:hypothetical protein